MVWAAIESTGCKPKKLADAGYFSRHNVELLRGLGIQAFIPPDKVKHGLRPAPSPLGRIPRGLAVAGLMWRRLATTRGRKGYKPRMESVAPVFGQIKQAQGFRRFSLRGLLQVQGEWALVCLSHNLLKLLARRLKDGPKMKLATT